MLQKQSEARKRRVAEGTGKMTVNEFMKLSAEERLGKADDFIRGFNQVNQQDWNFFGKEVERVLYSGNKE